MITDYCATKELKVWDYSFAHGRGKQVCFWKHPYGCIEKYISQQDFATVILM